MKHLTDFIEFITQTDFMQAIHQLFDEWKEEEKKYEWEEKENTFS